MAFFTREQELPMQRWFDCDDHYEDYGFAILAEADGHDLYVWEAMYIIQGGASRPTSQWLGDGVVDNTLVVVAPQAWRHTGMHDNHFLRTGMSLPQYFSHGDLKIVETGDTVRWCLGDMNYVSYLGTGTHEIRGEHGGAEFDLTLVQLPGTPIVPLFGPLETAARTRKAGAYNYSTCSGTLRVGGKTWEIANGAGLHEHIAFAQCPDWDMAVVGPLRDRRGGGIFGSFRAGDVVFQIHSESPEDTHVAVAASGKDVLFHGAEVRLVAQERWVDPRSGVSVPCRWRLTCASALGRLEVDIDGYARANWPWELKRAVQLETVVLASASGSFAGADGARVEIADALAIMDYTRMLLCHTETLDGPDPTPTW